MDREQACINALETTFNSDNPPEDAEFRDQIDDGDVLDALHQEFQGVDILLCRWHLNKDVMAYARTKCPQLGRRLNEKKELVDTTATELFASRFQELIRSPTVEDFEKGCQEVKKMSPKMAKYLEDNWWKYKEKIVHCWTSKFTSFGLIATSIVEGGHARIKRWLGNSRADVVSLFDCLHRFFESHIGKVRRRDLHDSTYNIPNFAIGNTLYDDVVRRVHRYALGKLEENFQKAQEHRNKGKDNPFYRVPSCKEQYSKEWGLPCYHDCIKLLDAHTNGQAVHVSVEGFHKHWLLDRSAKSRPTLPRIREPIVRPKSTKRMKKSKTAGNGQSGNRRDPSGFEIAEASKIATPVTTSTQPAEPQERIWIVPSTAPAPVALHPCSNSNATRSQVPLQTTAQPTTCWNCPPAVYQDTANNTQPVHRLPRYSETQSSYVSPYGGHLGQPSSQPASIRPESGWERGYQTEVHQQRIFQGQIPIQNKALESNTTYQPLPIGPLAVPPLPNLDQHQQLPHHPYAELQQPLPPAHPPVALPTAQQNYFNATIVDQPIIGDDGTFQAYKPARSWGSAGFSHTYNY